MNSPYTGKFRVTQAYKGAVHDGLDLVGVDSKEIHSTVNGTVVFAGWENSADHSQGFGQYVKIKQSGTDDCYFFGHLSKIFAEAGQAVRITDVIGIEGSTGRSTGSHCHYCVRIGGVKGQHKDVSAISGIPNALGVYDDGYSSTKSDQPSAPERWDYQYDAQIAELQQILNAKGASLAVDGKAGERTLAAVKRYTIENGDKGPLTKWVQQRLSSMGYSCGTADGIAGTKTMTAIARFQEENGLGVGYLGGEDWYCLIR